MIEQWLLDNMACPRCGSSLNTAGEKLTCLSGHSYPVIEGIPVMLLEDAGQTCDTAVNSIKLMQNLDLMNSLASDGTAPVGIDPFVQEMVAATNGLMFKPLIGKLKEYPIPELRMTGSGEGYFIDIGCSWGRWCVAASRRGFKPVGIDPSIEAILAARRVSRQLGVQSLFVVGDARFLPFKSSVFDFAFSYSVLQHFDKKEAKMSLRGIGRVLKNGGRSMIQLPNAFGLRNIYNAIRRGFRKPKGFDVRYWTPRELISTFAEIIGPSRLSVDGYFSLNAQRSESAMLPLRYRAVINLSETLRRLSGKVRFMSYFADSLYLESVKK